MQNLLDSAGEYRRIQVLTEKADHEVSSAFEIPDLVKEFVVWNRQNRKKTHPFELAVLLHTKFVAIYPFGWKWLGCESLNEFRLERNAYLSLSLEEENATSMRLPR